MLKKTHHLPSLCYWIWCQGSLWDTYDDIITTQNDVAQSTQRLRFFFIQSSLWFSEKGEFVSGCFHPWGGGKIPGRWISEVSIAGGAAMDGGTGGLYLGACHWNSAFHPSSRSRYPALNTEPMKPYEAIYDVMICHECRDVMNIIILYNFLITPRFIKCR